MTPDLSRDRERADVSIPELLRVAWVSAEVRRVRGARLTQISRAWETVEWQSVNFGVRPVALRLSFLEDVRGLQEQIRAAGLYAAPMRVEEVLFLGEPTARMIVHVAIGRKKDVKLFKVAWIEGGSEDQGRLLGYPACCRVHFAQCFETESLTDPNLSIARNTAGAIVQDRSVTVGIPGSLNTLLRALNLRSIPHFPCRFDCEQSLFFARQFADVAKRLGFAAEAEDLEEILSWPMEATMLHGVAEVRTPILKFATRTDPTREKWSLRWKGQDYPPDGAAGLSFPYCLGAARDKRRSPRATS